MIVRAPCVSLPLFLEVGHNPKAKSMQPNFYSYFTVSSTFLSYADIAESISTGGHSSYSIFESTSPAIVSKSAALNILNRLTFMFSGSTQRSRSRSNPNGPRTVAGEEQPGGEASPYSWSRP